MTPEEWEDHIAGKPTILRIITTAGTAHYFDESGTGALKLTRIETETDMAVAVEKIEGWKRQPHSMSTFKSGGIKMNDNMTAGEWVILVLILVATASLFGIPIYYAAKHDGEELVCREQVCAELKATSAWWNREKHKCICVLEQPSK